MIESELKIDKRPQELPKLMLDLDHYIEVVTDANLDGTELSKARNQIATVENFIDAIDKRIQEILNNAGAETVVQEEMKQFLAELGIIRYSLDSLLKVATYLPGNDNDAIHRAINK